MHRVEEVAVWSHEHTAETALAPEQIWAVLSDIDHWAVWDTSLETVELLGPFAVGTEVAMTPTGQDQIRSVIVEIVENERYGDRTVFGDVTLQFSHHLIRRPDGGTHLRHRLEITGPGADQTGPELGPAITADFPEAMEALIRQAAAAADAPPG